MNIIKLLQLAIVLTLIIMTACAPSDHGKTIPNMPEIGASEFAFVIRTHFGDDEEWKKIKNRIIGPSADGGFYAYVDFIEDPEHEKKDKSKILEAIGNEYGFGFIMIADEMTFSHRDNPILVVDLDDKDSNDFRTTPEHAHAIENNLSIMNMDFFEFAEGVDPDGIFRGFPKE